MKVQVGVMGSAGGRMRKDTQRRARELGRAIAENDCVLVTGACPGLPYDAVCGCKEAGGLTAGISPALDLYEHLAGKRHGEAMRRAKEGDWLGMSKAMRDSRYFIGTKPYDQAVATHQRKVIHVLKRIVAATGEPARIPEAPPKSAAEWPPTSKPLPAR